MKSVRWLFFMKSKFKYFISIIFFVAILSANLITNMWMLLTDDSNYIPAESNIIFFTLTQIDNGSGGYWRYGKDLKNYYHFSLIQSNFYYLISKKNNCPQFSELSFETWCEEYSKKYK